ncbi:MAG: hypothetical protein M1837_006575 [Sclerophora amabilis]|nr:MAG: hypothetical protein M1837_006575 [Sclerophora amabilis]
MTQKPLTVATYAAGASLAAIALVFVFGPTFCIDGDESGASSSTRKKGVVGLFNPANDCFINSVLQSLAGLGDLRTYLIREGHRRTLDPDLYKVRPHEQESGKALDLAKLEGLQQGIVGQALKEVLDNLNERPIYRKTISAKGFVSILEQGFRQRISRQQQDAQEFLQVVAERLSEEYHAGQKARERTGQVDVNGPERSTNERPADTTEKDINGSADGAIQPPSLGKDEGPMDKHSSAASEKPPSPSHEAGDKDEEDEEEEGFPFEGKLSSQIECLKCHFKPKPRISTFVTLTLHVPHDSSSTTLSHCFDILFKTEYIDDFRCDKCRLLHALSFFSQQLSRSTSTSDPSHSTISQHIDAVQHTLATDPETPPASLPLPPLSSAPTSQIARHVRLVSFPKIVAIHLSRSIFSPYSASTKNSAKVSFPEQLPLGGLLDQRKYKLLGVVTHKGSHNSGHYESFRRQNMYPPFATRDAFKPSGPYSIPGTPGGSPVRSPEIVPWDRDTRPSTTTKLDGSALPSPHSELASISSTSSSSRPASISTSSLFKRTTRPQSSSSISISKTRPPSSSSISKSIPESATPPTTTTTTTTLIPPPPNASSRAPHPPQPASASDPQKPAPRPSSKSSLKLRKKPHPHSRTTDRWWQISDDKVKEARTRDVLSKQREVYLLFYELDRTATATEIRHPSSGRQ